MAKKNTQPVHQMKKLMDIVLEQYPAESDRIIARALEINQCLCEENANQTHAELQHTRDKIYPAISIYKAISEITGDTESAYQTVESCINIESDKIGRTIRALCKVPFSYKLVPAIMRGVIHKTFGEKSGFSMIDYPIEKGRCHIDMTACPYFSNCVKYKCAELCTVFCNGDDIAFGNMHPKLFWGRSKTLARGNDYCDFILEIRK